MCGRSSVFFSPQKRDVPGKDFYAVEVEMPVDKYWEVEELIKTLIYLSANSDDSVKVQELLKKIHKILAPFAISEKDRVFLYEQAAAPRS